MLSSSVYIYIKDDAVLPKLSAPAEGRRYLAEYYTVISTEGPLLFTLARSKSLFNTTVDMKLKQIFALLGVALLGLSACSKDTPKTNPASSSSLAGSQWEYIEQEQELEDDGKTETTTTVLRFIDGTKFVTESTSVTTQGGTILKTETDTPKQGTYTYQGKEVTLTTTHQDDGKIRTSIVRLVMDDTNQTLAGTVTDDGVRKGIIYTRKK